MAKKIQPLRIYLIKKSVKTFKDSLRNDVSLKEFDLKKTKGVNGKFFLRPAVKRKVDWFDFVQSGLKDKLPSIHSVANAGVLFLKVGGRIFALVFGTGRYLLKDTSYETDFGLRSTLNSIDPKSLDQIDVQQFGEQLVQKRIQVTRQGSLEGFDIDVGRERFKSLTGKAKDDKFATRVIGTGAGFGVHSKINFKELVEHCKKCLTAYQATTYQKAFPRYDDFAVVKDVAAIKTLNAKLVSRLEKKSKNGIHMSPPELIDYETFSGYSFSPKGDVKPELLVSDYFDSGKDFTGITLEKIKSHRIYLRLDGAPEPVSKWSAFRCLICEIKSASSVHVLWDGKWYKIAKSFAENVRKEIESIPVAKTCLPAKTKKKKEADFLDEVDKASASVALMDQNNVWCDNAGSPIEVCDLFSETRQFIHVKRRVHGASGFSHLFAQGRNSAEAFLKDASFRAETKTKLTAIANKFGAKVTKSQPTTSKYEVVYAVMGKKRGNFIKELPFFSQLTLHLVAQDLRSMGFKVSYQFVEAPE